MIFYPLYSSQGSPAGLPALYAGNKDVSKAVSGASLPSESSQPEASLEQVARALFGNFPRGQPLPGTTGPNGLPLRKAVIAVESGIQGGIKAALGTRG